jgi:ornithine cyclodeaminase
MPSNIQSTGGLGLKIVSVRTENSKKNLPVCPATIVLFNEETGVLEGVIDASELTALRTASGSCVATKYLSKENSKILVCFGSGAQAKWHIIGMICVRPSIELVKIHSRNEENSKKLAEQMSKEFPNVKFQSISDAKDISDADIIVTATNTSIPIFYGEDLPKGVHINCIGSYTPTMQEVDEVTIKRSKVCVDDYEAALTEAGDLIVPLEKSIINESHIKCDLGKICFEGKGFRESDDDITLFKSVGLAFQDVILGHHILKVCEKMNLGQVL